VIKRCSVIFALLVLLFWSISDSLSPPSVSADSRSTEVSTYPAPFSFDVDVQVSGVSYSFSKTQVPEGTLLAVYLYNQFNLLRQVRVSVALPASHVFAQDFPIPIGISDSGTILLSPVIPLLTETNLVNGKMSLDMNLALRANETLHLEFLVTADQDLRTALKSYYQRWGEYFSSSEIGKGGLWLFHADIRDMEDPGLFAYHELGEIQEMQRWRSQGDPEEIIREMITADETAGVGSYRYVIPGQRELVNLPELPGSDEAALAVYYSQNFQEFEPYAPDESPEGVRYIIENSWVRKIDGAPRMSIRNTPWGNNSITFPLNSAPYTPQGRRILFKSLNFLQSNSQVDGIYVDSLSGWGQVRDYSAKALQNSQFPPSTDKYNLPFILNHFSIQYLLDTLQQLDTTIFANGIRPQLGQWFYTINVDIFGQETTEPFLKNFFFLRAVAYQRPAVTLLYPPYDRERVERYFKMATLYGIYPSFGDSSYWTQYYARDRDLFVKYVPQIRRLNQLGWNPVAPQVPNILVECFGCTLVMYNNSTEPKETEYGEFEPGELKVKDIQCIPNSNYLPVLMK
jgi:hypothetical protein